MSKYDVSGLPTEFFNPGELDVFLDLIAKYRPRVVANTLSQTLPFPFSGYFAAGTKLRFVVWASGSGVTIQTAINNESTFPAGRLTYIHIVGARLP